MSFKFAYTGMMLIALQGEMSALTEEEKLLMGSFLMLPQEQIIQFLRVLLHWERAPVPSRAMALQLLAPGLAAKPIAEMCGRSPRQLRRYPHYQELSRLLRQQGGKLPLGSKDSEGQVEAAGDDDVWGDDE